MAMLELQKGIIFRPANSRRLGGSLEINLLPITFKLRSMPRKTIRSPLRRGRDNEPGGEAGQSRANRFPR